MKKLLKTLALFTTGLVVGVAVKRVYNDIEELKFKTSSNTGKLSTRPGLSEIDRLDLRLDNLVKEIERLQK